MKALDTNILVRLLVSDDPAMENRAVNLLKRARQEGEKFFVPIPAVVELLWVLRKSYGYARGDVLGALGLLLGMPVLEFERPDIIQDLIRRGATESLDLPDLLIGLCSRRAGCETTLTFDKKAGRSELFEILG